MSSEIQATMPRIPMLSEFGRWALRCGLLGLLVGSACALFLAALDRVTRMRFEHPDLLWLLPIAGAMTGWMYLRWGQSVTSGNNLLIEQIQSPVAGVPLRLAPLVFLGTLLTHLCGGSAGREGTAVQMGGGIAGGLVRLWPGLSAPEVRVLLMAGVAAGFGGVFGTPVAGMVFALEVAVLGRIEKRAVLPCLVASLVSDWMCTAWGIGHTRHAVQSLIPEGAILPLTPLNGQLLLFAMCGGVLFGLTARLFAGMAHGVQNLLDRYCRNPIMKPMVGACVVIALVCLLGSRDFLGLGVSSPDPAAATIVNAFHAGGVQPWSWGWKLVLTAVTLGSGFKGGEATPLFFIGAALGNTLAILAGMPVDFCVALGFVSVFAGATHTPIACTVMAVEIFGGESIVYYAISCLLAHRCGGRGVYPAQQGAPVIERQESPEQSGTRNPRSPG
jgi:H+/Cl- antiporter ClcA